MKAERFPNNPIIYPNMDSRMGANINGPSLIRVPEWIEKPRGRYYLYFGHHDGRYIRLAYADHLVGPWTTHEPGVLDVDASFFAGHIASPDVHVDDARREIRLYYHGANVPSGAGGTQASRLALSSDGLHFTARPELLGLPYFRVFRWGGYHYALGMPGVFYRSRDGLTGFEQGPTLFGANMRHSAFKLDGNILSVFYTNAGDCPECILLSKIELHENWMSWTTSPPEVVLSPERAYEGGDLPRARSARGLIMTPVCQLRDPAIFQEYGHAYLLYAVAGEQGIGVAEL